MLSRSKFTWKLEALIADKTESPTVLFEKFFSDDILEQICESIKYKKIKRSHNFELDVDTLKAFYYLTYKWICWSPKMPHVLGKYCRCAKYRHTIIHVKKQIWWNNVKPLPHRQFYPRS